MSDNDAAAIWQTAAGGDIIPVLDIAACHVGEPGALRVLAIDPARGRARR